MYYKDLIVIPHVLMFYPTHSTRKNKKNTKNMMKETFKEFNVKYFWKNIFYNFLFFFKLFS